MITWEKTNTDLLISLVGLEDKVFDLNIARCFVNYMYRLLGNYYKFMDNDGVLDNEIFLECQPPQFEYVRNLIHPTFSICYLLQ